MLAARSRAEAAPRAPDAARLADRIDDAIWGVDDWNHTSCSGFDAMSDASECETVDDAYCDAAEFAYSDSWPFFLSFVGCTTCNGTWGNCLLAQVADIRANCHRRARASRTARSRARTSRRL